MKPQKVLVIDDDELVRNSIARLLTTLGFEPLGAENVQEAFAVLEKHAVGAILVDLNLNGDNGFQAGSELLEAASKGQAEQRPRLVAMSGAAAQDIVAGGVFDSYLPKPFSMEMLKEALAAG